MAKKEIDVSYAYNKAFELIDYKGKVREKLASGVSNTEFSYGYEYSPNNIRRLIISPDAVMVFYHIAVVGACKEVRFNPIELAKAMQAGAGKRILEVLTADRKCSCIEEIIFLSQPVQAPQRPSSPLDIRREAEFGALGIVPGQRSTTFPRLKYITMINTTYPQFAQVIREQMKGYLFITELYMDMYRAMVVGSPYTFGNLDNWYELGATYGRLQGGYYVMDNKNNEGKYSLRVHFKKVYDKVAAIEKKEEDTKKSEGRYKGLIEDMQKEYRKYKSAYICYFMLLHLVTDNKNALGVQYYDIQPPTASIQLYRTQGVDGIEDGKRGITFIGKDNHPEDECLRYNAKLLKKAKSALYMGLIESFLRGIEALRADLPLLAGVLKSDFDRVLAIPPSCEAMNSYWQFKGVEFEESFSNLCSYIVRVFVSGQRKSSVRRYETGDVWMEVFS